MFLFNTLPSVSFAGLGYEEQKAVCCARSIGRGSAWVVTLAHIFVAQVICKSCGTRGASSEDSAVLMRESELQSRIKTEH